MTTGHMVNSVYVGLALQVVGAGRGGSGSRRGGNCALNIRRPMRLVGQRVTMWEV